MITTKIIKYSTNRFYLQSRIVRTALSLILLSFIVCSNAACSKSTPTQIQEELPSLTDTQARKYVPVLNRKIKAHLKLPENIEEKLVTTVIFRIDREGNIVSQEFALLSGNQLFDDSIKNALARMKKFPPLPDDFLGDLTEIKLNFKSKK